MNHPARLVLLIAGLGLITLLAGCPGMPGGGGSSAQQSPPGVQPPPGLTSGGVRTLLGTTVTPPENSFLLVSFTSSTGASAQKLTARRITISENTVLFEGLNYDARNPKLPADTNTIFPLAQLTALSWSYEAKPTPPPSQTGKPGGLLGRGGAPSGQTPPGPPGQTTRGR